MSTASLSSAPEALQNGCVCLPQLYENYIQAINQRDWGVFETMVQPNVSWNEETYTADEYISLITRTTIPAPDLQFHIDWLVADEPGQRVAARLLIRGTPREEFLGIPPNGKLKPVEVVEHAFYRFEGGKVAEVQTLIDMEGLREQMR
ncbi:hypothetical protein DRE_02355 [Drechslerella stenobrocha 248]|uniref:Ester cyclase n=1 Tax=Drechslerella stenobrocha 248 TaxID=1043628 RepID=W7HVN4_9PEZI|nr:hypothetical protein DRE_02355 [Drechslerella stenobrocha 248]